MLQAKANGSDMLITISGTNDSILLKNYADANKRIEHIRLSDGSEVAIADIQGATSGDDYLVYGDEGVSVDALAGDDTVISGSGADSIIAGEGDKIKSKNTTHKPLNNICTPNTFTFIKKQDIMTDYFKRVA